MSAVRLITFDFVGTLASFRTRPTTLYIRAAQKHGLTINPEIVPKQFKQVYKEMSQEAPNFGYRHMSSEEWWTTVITRTLTASKTDNVENEAQKLNVISKELIRVFSSNNAYQIYPEVKLVLRNLRKRNLRLGVISNNDERLHSIMEGLQLTPFFDFVLTSKECGIQKPDPEMFHRALDLAEVKASEALHVGDKEKEDLFGAQAAGLQGLLVVRDMEEVVKKFEEHGNVIPDLMPLHSGYNFAHITREE